MRFEVTDKREEKTGFLFKKPIYLARVALHLSEEEFEALKSMASQKDWQMYPLGEMNITKKHRREVTVEMAFSWAKKTRIFSKAIRTPLPEDRELQIDEFKEIGANLKQVIEARVNALSASDEDVVVEL